MFISNVITEKQVRDALAQLGEAVVPNAFGNRTTTSPARAAQARRIVEAMGCTAQTFTEHAHGVRIRQRCTTVVAMYLAEFERQSRATENASQ